MKKLYFLIISAFMLLSVQIHAGSVKFPSLDQLGWLHVIRTQRIVSLFPFLNALLGILGIIRNATNTRIVRTDKTPGVEILVLLDLLDQLV